jgi:hypothetical protein
LTHDEAGQGSGELVELVEGEVEAIQGCGRFAAGLFEALPKTFAGGADLFGFVEDKKGFGGLLEEGGLAGTKARDMEFPAGEDVAFDATELVEEGPGAGEFEEREEGDFVELEDRALGFDVEGTERFDGVAEQFDADGLVGFGGEDVDDAAADGILADHFDGLALFVADGVEVGDQLLHGDLFVGAESDGELAVEFGSFGAEEDGTDGSDGDGRGAAGETVEADGALFGDVAVGREVLEGEYVEGWDVLGLALGVAAEDEEVEEGVDEFGEGFGLFAAVDDDDDGTLDNLPEQYEVEGLGGGSEAGEIELARLAVVDGLGGLPGEFVKSRMAGERL